MPLRRLFTPSLGPSNWRAFLADSFVQWRREKSAWELAVSWEAAAKTNSGIPSEVLKALHTHDTFATCQLIAAIPEHRVILDDERRPSQNDLWAILWTPRGHASVTIEAKAGEEFDRPIEQWLGEDSKGKDRRLQFLTRTLCLSDPPPGHVRYQLVHRTASAILEARRCHFPLALMLVQSFEESATAWSDYAAFLRCLDLDAARGALAGPKQIQAADGTIGLYIGWVDSQKASDETAAKAV